MANWIIWSNFKFDPVYPHSPPIRSLDFEIAISHEPTVRFFWFFLQRVPFPWTLNDELCKFCQRSDLSPFTPSRVQSDRSIEIAISRELTVQFFRILQRFFVPDDCSYNIVVSLVHSLLVVVVESKKFIVTIKLRLIVTCELLLVCAQLGRFIEAIIA